MFRMLSIFGVVRLGFVQEMFLQLLSFGLLTVGIVFSVLDVLKRRPDGSDVAGAGQSALAGVPALSREELARITRSVKYTAAALPLTSVLFVYVASVLGNDARPGGPGSGAMGPLSLLVFGALALSPALVTPFLRAMFARSRRRAASRPGRVNAQALLSLHAISEYAIWEISSLVGFVAFVLGATWLFFIGAVLVSLIGYVISFPRWSRILEYADDLTCRGPLGATANGGH
jgi:hypothetical protein